MPMTKIHLLFQQINNRTNGIWPQKNSPTNSKIPWQFPDILVKTEFPDCPESGNPGYSLLRFKIKLRFKI